MSKCEKCGQVIPNQPGLYFIMGLSEKQLEDLTPEQKRQIIDNIFPVPEKDRTRLEILEEFYKDVMYANHHYWEYFPQDFNSVSAAFERCTDKLLKPKEVEGGE